MGKEIVKTVFYYGIFIVFSISLGIFLSDRDEINWVEKAVLESYQKELVSEIKQINTEIANLKRGLEQ